MSNSCSASMLNTFNRLKFMSCSYSNLRFHSCWCSAVVLPLRLNMYPFLSCHAVLYCTDCVNELLKYSVFHRLCSNFCSLKFLVVCCYCTIVREHLQTFTRILKVKTQWILSTFSTMFLISVYD